MSPAPITTGSSDVALSRGRASARSRSPASARATAAARWLGATWSGGDGRCDRADRESADRPISAHRDQVRELAERLLADELARAQVVDGGEWLLVA